MKNDFIELSQETAIYIQKTLLKGDFFPIAGMGFPTVGNQQPLSIFRMLDVGIAILTLLKMEIEIYRSKGRFVVIAINLSSQR